MNTIAKANNDLEIKNICKNFGGVKALNQCSFSVMRNSITAIIGPNGSGKTTLFNVISRFIHEDQGEIKVKNQSLSKKKDFQVGKGIISRSYQKTRLFRNLTIRDHLLIALQTEDEKFFHSTLFPQKFTLEELQKHLDFVGLEIPLSMKASDLSYGQSKLLDLAVAIAKPHKILLLDEPVAGVNPKLRKQISLVIKKLAKQGDTIVIIEHDMNFVMDIAEYVYVLDAGTVLSKGIPKQIQKDPKVLAAYLGVKKKEKKVVKRKAYGGNKNA